MLLAREVGHLSACVKVLQLPADRYRRSLPKQVGINLAAAMSTTQLLSTPAAPSSGGQVTSPQTTRTGTGASSQVVIEAAAPGKTC